MLRCVSKCGLIILLGAMLGATASRADMLVMQDGRIVEGEFVAGSEAFIQFRSEGKIESYPRAEVSAIHLSPLPASASAAGVPTNDSLAAVSPAAADVAPALAAGAVLVPAGTKLVVKFSKTVSSSSHKAGASVQATLESDVVVNGAVAVAKGSAVTGQVVEARGGKQIGAMYLKLKLTSVAVRNQKVPIVTSAFGVEGGADGKGKVVGADFVTVPDEKKTPLLKDNHAQLPAGTVLEVPLKESVALYP
jgi:hypothetical protein